MSAGASLEGLAVAGAVALILGGAPASAAQTPSWNTVQDAPGGMNASVAEWPSGVQILSRCSDGVFSLMFAAVHDGPAAQTHYRLNGGEWERVHWDPAQRSRLFFSRTPARMARKFSAGGALELRFSSDEARPVLYQLDLPSDGEALRSVVSACGLPLVDPRDDLSIVDNVDWLSRPSGRDFERHYPLQGGGHGATSVLCIVRRSGSLDDCELTYETPPAFDFGHATLALMPHFRLAREQAIEFEGRLVSIPIGWRMH